MAAVLTFRGLSATVEAGGEMLIASDLHFDPFADPSLASRLAGAPVSQWEAILNRSQAGFSRYGQDPNWALLQSALDNMRSTLPHPALVMITGDLLAHGFPQKYRASTGDQGGQHYRAFVAKTVEFLALQLRRRFPGVQILITPGNNDDDCGDYQIEAGGPFLDDTAAVAAKLAEAGGEFRREWKRSGSYSIELRAPALRTPGEPLGGLRVLSINTVFFSNKYQAASLDHACSAVASASAAETLDWLQAELAQAKAAQAKVWLMMHIPPGIDGFSSMAQFARGLLAGQLPGPELCHSAIVPMWKPEWTMRFANMVADYPGTIAAAFAGHNHSDDFRLLGADAGFVLIDPPVSPIYGQNPAFRVVSFGRDGALADQSTYYLTNLSQAGGAVAGTWTREYDFRAEWGQAQLDAASLAAVYEQIAREAGARDRWLRLLNVSSSAVRVPGAGVKALSCAIDALDPASYQSCACPTPLLGPTAP